MHEAGTAVLDCHYSQNAVLAGAALAAVVGIGDMSVGWELRHCRMAALQEA